MRQSDTEFTFAELQNRQGRWADHNFPDTPAHRPLLGAGEELGELFHAHLKMEQNIRGDGGTHALEAKDAIGDVLIYLAHYCNLRGFDMGQIARETMEHVEKRDWIACPHDGITY